MHSKLPQPYRYKIAKAKFEAKGGSLKIDAPNGIDEADLDLLTAALEIFSDTQKEDKKGISGK